MGFIHKGGVCCFLLLAGVLLAAAAAGAEQHDGAVATAVPEVDEAEEVRLRVDDQGNDSCDLKCQHHQVPARKKQCVDECHSREHHHPSRASCETKCSHWVDPTRKEQCVQQCMRYGLGLHVGGVEEHPHAEEAEVGRHADDQGNDSCDLKCQHHQVPARKKQCVDECHSREHHHPSRASCETKCSHWVDPTRKEQCVQQCMRRGLSLDVGGSNAVDEHPHAQEEEVARRPCDRECHLSCEVKCMNWKDRTKHQQCVQQCIRGSNIVGDEHPHAQEEEVARRPCDRECQFSCQGKCQGWKDRTKYQQCVQQCIRGSNIVGDEHLRGWEAVAGAILEVV